MEDRVYMGIRMRFIDPYVPFILRLFLVILFPFSALDKIVHWDTALQQANSSFLPGGNVLLILGAMIEIIAPLCILLQKFDRLAAFLLAGFCIVTAFLYQNFWDYPGGFFVRGDGGPALSHLWEFLKNFGLAGGLLFITLDAKPQPFSEFLHKPISSTRRMKNITLKMGDLP